MIGELIGLAFVIGFMLFFIAGVGIILIDREGKNKWQQKKWQIIIL